MISSIFNVTIITKRQRKEIWSQVFIKENKSVRISIAESIPGIDYMWTIIQLCFSTDNLASDKNKGKIKT